MIFESYSQIPNVALLDPSCLENLLVTKSCLAAGLLLRKGGRGFFPATTSLSPSYFDRKRKYWKEKNASNYKIMN